MGLLAAFAGGLISFLSPCVLPIVPGYLTVITGTDLTDGSAGQRWRVLRHTLLFVAGFSVVFVLLGLTATTVGRTLFANQALLTRLAGAMLIVMAVYLLGSVLLRAPWLYQDRRFHPELSRFGPFAAPVAGVAFGLGWTPCIGPVLTSVLAIAATRGQASEGATLLAAYSLGLGVPFVLTGLLFQRLVAPMAWVKRHLRALTVASASSLAGFGLLLVSGQLLWVTTQLQRALTLIGLEELVFLG